MLFDSIHFYWNRLLLPFASKCLHALDQDFNRLQLHTVVQTCPQKLTSTKRGHCPQANNIPFVRHRHKLFRSAATRKRHVHTTPLPHIFVWCNPKAITVVNRIVQQTTFCNRTSFHFFNTPILFHPFTNQSVTNIL